jgi:transcriptional regulator with PAS, ATPase and Fis domain
MHSILEMVKKVAPTDANILLLGENGTGKELVAREIHRMSLQSHDPFVHVDLGAVSENLFESELFGHVKGAFTDAREDRAGRFEIAKGGTLFLDEIGNLPVYLQSKLLSAFQNREIIRLGSNEPRELDVRLISATNRDLTHMVSKNLFRQDLLYRIETIRIEIPPLRDRKEDIPQLTDHFLQMYGTKYGKPGLRINEPALHKLARYSWPGNVRELKHAIEKAVILCDTGTITPDGFMFPSFDGPAMKKQSLKLHDLEKEAIQEALRKTKMNLSEAARELGISRPTLYKKINKYNIQL